MDPDPKVGSDSKFNYKFFKIIKLTQKGLPKVIISSQIISIKQIPYDLNFYHHGGTFLGILGLAKGPKNQKGTLDQEGP